ncbi:CsbD family protein [Streptococcus sp. H49]|uniref:CsbD family protein n=1 Tax=Streptococcus huangxiaojuni TaxID=3237239 RepID=UPI0034A58359
MEKAKYKAKEEQVKGSLKETAGKITGNKEKEIKGKAEKLSGKTKEKAIEVKEVLSDAADEKPTTKKKKR